jgi:hypothetical protein
MDWSIISTRDRDKIITRQLQEPYLELKDTPTKHCFAKAYPEQTKNRSVRKSGARVLIPLGYLHTGMWQSLF